MLWIDLSCGDDVSRGAYDALADRISLAHSALECVLKPRSGDDIGWLPLVCASFHLGSATTVQAEFSAMIQGVFAIHQFVSSVYVCHPSEVCYQQCVCGVTRARCVVSSVCVGTYAHIRVGG